MYDTCPWITSHPLPTQNKCVTAVIADRCHWSASNTSYTRLSRRSAAHTAMAWFVLSTDVEAQSGLGSVHKRVRRDVAARVCLDYWPLALFGLFPLK